MATTAIRSTPSPHSSIPPTPFSAVPPSPPPSSKTHAFFASSFAATPTPPRPLSLKKADSSSSTSSTDSHYDLDATGDAESGAAASNNNQGLFAGFNVSRIFPSRYTRARRDSSERLDLQDAFSSNGLRRKPEFLFVDVNTDVYLPLPKAPPYHDPTSSDSSVSPPSSISSSPSHVEISLPTPPPPPPPLLTATSAPDNETDFTPRPPPGFESPPQQHQMPPSIPPDPELHEGDVIANATASSASPSLRLISPLGHGAFSAVWLAEDLTAVPLTLASKKSVRDLKRQASQQSKAGLSRRSSQKSSRNSARGNLSRNSSLKKYKAPALESELLSVDDHDRRREPPLWVDDLGRLLPTSPPSTTSPLPPLSPLPILDIDLPSISRPGSANGRHSASRVVAVKLTPRRPDPHSSQAEERTRVGFVREVEVLRHISHPNITAMLAFFSTPTHHVLVLPYLKGGDLLSLVNNDAQWELLTESIVRRIWCEICRAVGWMHSVGLVHRDIKLENVLLNWDGLEAYTKLSAFDLHTNQSSRLQLSDLPTPLIKLTDFGLSRFIDIGNGQRGQGEKLSTRCGSEAYAAPELVIGGTPRGVYDARETDAWACGVVLFALFNRKLPFGEGVGMDGVRGNTSRIGGERVHAYGYGTRKHATERRAWLMRIARGEYEWPEAPEVEDGKELVGADMVRSAGARRVAARLLVRNPKKRAMIEDLWEDEWMRADIVGQGEWESLQYERMAAGSDASLLNSPPHQCAGTPQFRLHSVDDAAIPAEPTCAHEGAWEPIADPYSDGDDDILHEEEEEEDEQEGWLLDEESIASIARQEVV